MKRMIGPLFMALVMLTGSKLFSQQIEPTTTINICKNKTTILLFPAAITDGDRGSSDIITKTSKKSVNILKVKAAQENFKPTNLSIITADGRLYSINVQYDPFPKELAYNFRDSSEHTNPPVQFNGSRMNDDSIMQMALTTETLKPFLRKPAYNRYQVEASLAAVYIKAGVLFFRFSIHNRSTIPYQVDFARYGQKDKSVSKKTSMMEKGMIPLYSSLSCGSTIDSGNACTLVAAFDQFTIADRKYFSFELYEKNGDRNIHFNIKGKQILKARSL